MENTHQSDRNVKPVRYDRYRLRQANNRSPRQRIHRIDHEVRKPRAEWRTPVPNQQQWGGQSPLASNRKGRMWWTHVWSGLVRDPTGKHYKKLKSSVWLYLYLLLGANWRTGKLFRRVGTISKDMAIPDRTITRWLKILRDGGYIESTTKSRVLQISITKWRSVARGKTVPREPPE